MLGPKYAFISAYLKGEEAKVITSERIEGMFRASKIQDALATVRDTDVGSYLEELPVNTFEELDKYLWKYFVQRISDVESFKFMPGDILKVSKTYIVKFDVLNIKTALQGISIGRKADMISAGIIYNNESLDELSGAKNIGDIAEILGRNKLGDYVPIIEEYKIDGGVKARLMGEAKLDGEYYKNMLRMAKGIKDGSVLSQVLGIIIDLTNLQIAFRAIIDGVGADAVECTIPGGYMIPDGTIKDLLSSGLADIPRKLEDSRYRDIAEEISANYESNKNITVVDETIEKHKFGLAKEILSPRVLSPLVMAWYLILKEIEIRNLRLVLKAIYDALPVEEVKRYLVL